MLPSRSSKSLVTELPERPFACVNRSVLPWCTCKRPRSRVPIHRPPSRSRSSLAAWNRGPVPGSGYASAFPSTSCLIPSWVAIKSAPWLPSFHGACRCTAGLASDRVSEGQASIATARSGPPPKDCPRHPHTMKPPTGRDCRHLRSTGRCHSESRRASQWNPHTRRPIPCLHDPQGAHDILSGKLRVLSQLAVLPTGQPFVSANPKTSIARGEHASNIGAGEMLARGRLPGDAPNTVEAKQAEFRAEPEITVGRLSNRVR